MPIVEVNGQELEFPDDMQPDAIREVLRVKFPIKNDSQKSALASGLQNIIKAEIGGEQTAPESAFQVMGELARPIAEPIQKALSHLTPEFVDKASAKVGEFASPYLPEFTDRQKRNLSAASNISTVGGAASVLGKTGQAIMSGNNLASRMIKDESSAGMFDKSRQAFENRRANFVQDLIMPKQTPKEIADTALQRSSGGGFSNKQVYSPNAFEAETAKIVAKTGVKKTLPLVDNLQIINKARINKAENLQRSLNAINVELPPSAMNSYSQEIADNIANNNLLRPHGETVKGLLDTAQSFIDANPKTPAGLWAARKQFDAAIKDFAPNSLDADAPSKAFSFAAKTIRNGLNKAIIESAPDAKVADFLKEYTHLSDAIDNIRSKVAQQPTDRFGRFLKTKTGKAVKYGAGAAATYGIGSAAINAVKGN